MQKKKNSLQSLLSFRQKTAYVTSVISISLLIFLLGIIGLLVFNAQKLSSYVKENIGFTVFLNDSLKEADMLRLQKQLNALPFVKDTRLVKKDEAAKVFQEELGENFVEFLGENPLKNSIDLFFHAEWANNDSLVLVERQLTQMAGIYEIQYHKSLIQQVNDNIKTISAVLSVFCLLLFLISAVLIHNTIRLSVYSKRFLIYTMQLVGATPAFVRSPFVLRGAVQGLYGAMLALVLLTGALFLFQNEFNDVAMYVDFELIGMLYGVLILISMALTAISTWITVNRYLNIKNDSLYI